MGGVVCSRGRHLLWLGQTHPLSTFFEPPENKTVMSAGSVLMTWTQATEKP